MHLITLMSSTLLFFQAALVGSSPLPSPQFSEIPVALQCASGSPTCSSKGLILTCVNGNLLCFGGMGMVSEECTEDGGYLCHFGCRSDLLKGFTNEKCEALFPGTRAVCRPY
ncbi:hypothetical protein QBC34DRAFT_420590 [Podospora aff. communis PSN243]|uniref:Extracellular membrane protein CFEM domain-containing protein n=1 Tax=Podospora aff. communis PSN243 TaxID=3040156 RepID=A0AAV9H5C8_9PEZI|nr:hypothetical protein QBC34DRAFT_420590 [Podospora aff. communis PSN243]